jgi:hypothetical protein
MDPNMDSLVVPKGGDNMPIKGLRTWSEVKSKALDKPFSNADCPNMVKVLNDLIVTEVSICVCVCMYIYVCMGVVVCVGICIYICYIYL